MVVTPNFHFLGNCMEGIELYKKVFGAKVLCLLKNKDADPVDYISDAKRLDPLNPEIMPLKLEVL